MKWEAANMETVQLEKYLHCDIWRWFTEFEAILNAQIGSLFAKSNLVNRVDAFKPAAEEDTKIKEVLKR